MIIYIGHGFKFYHWFMKESWDIYIYIYSISMPLKHTIEDPTEQEELEGSWAWCLAF
jgi:hypothetical protein